jgi:predicted MFS family arabinose efflux permease
MTAPPGSIKGELGDALVGGIRQRGSDAVGLVIMGIARLVVGAVTLGVLLGLGAVFGYDMTAGHFVGATVVAVVVSWLTGGESRSTRRNC